MLISDTGGGHRASANALRDMMEELRPEEVDVKVVDIWTEYGSWPHNKMAAGYPWLCKHRFFWRLMYFASVNRFSEFQWYWLTRFQCGGKFKRCIEEYAPDLVVSLHPLCQNLPLRNLKTLRREGKLGVDRKVPFATICTDLGGAHPSWFRSEVDVTFVASDSVRRLARRRGVPKGKLIQHGLPVRRDFWRPSVSKERTKEQFAALGLQPHKKTVLIVGGGDGVGSLGAIVDAIASRVARDLPKGEVQVIALCGKNKDLARQLTAQSESSNNGAWDGVHVEVRGFTSEISAFMDVADVLVTKAGPGTIAEAAIRALPTLISSFLPGQEAGNVKFVVDQGWGEFAPRPARIGKRVSAWLTDEKLLERMQTAARAVAAPQATRLIAADCLRLMDAAHADLA